MENHSITRATIRTSEVRASSDMKEETKNKPDLISKWSSWLLVGTLLPLPSVSYLSGHPPWDGASQDPAQAILPEHPALL